MNAVTAHQDIRTQPFSQQRSELAHLAEHRSNWLVVRPLQAVAKHDVIASFVGDHFETKLERGVVGKVTAETVQAAAPTRYRNHVLRFEPAMGDDAARVQSTTKFAEFRGRDFADAVRGFSQKFGAVEVTAKRLPKKPVTVSLTPTGVVERFSSHRQVRLSLHDNTNYEDAANPSASFERMLVNFRDKPVGRPPLKLTPNQTAPANTPGRLVLKNAASAPPSFLSRPSRAASLPKSLDQAAANLPKPLGHGATIEATTGFPTTLATMTTLAAQAPRLLAVLSNRNLQNLARSASPSAPPEDGGLTLKNLIGRVRTSDSANEFPHTSSPSGSSPVARSASSSPGVSFDDEAEAQK